MAKMQNMTAAEQQFIESLLSLFKEDSVSASIVLKAGLAFEYDKTSRGRNRVKIACNGKADKIGVITPFSWGNLKTSDFRRKVEAASIRLAAPEDVQFGLVELY